MGAHANITHDTFPAQSDWVGRRVRVCFDYDTSKTIDGTVMRCDVEEPGLMIIHLDDGRCVLSTECMYSLKRPIEKQPH